MEYFESVNPNDKVSIDFMVCGKAFDAGIPLHILLSSLNDFQDIIDKTFIALSDGKKKITREDRQRYYLITKGIHHSSIKSTLDIVLSAYPVVMPILSSFGPKGIWDITAQTFDYLKTIFEGFKLGKEIKHEFKNEGANSKMDVHIGDRIKNYYGPVYNIGQSALQSYQSLTGLLEKDHIDSICMIEKDSNTNGIKLGLKDKDLFKLPTKVEETQIEILCEIFDFNKYKKSGKLTSIDNSEIPQGEYSFEVIGAQDIFPFIEAMLKKMVRVKCLKEVSKDPFGKYKISQLQVITVGTTD